MNKIKNTLMTISSFFLLLAFGGSGLSYGFYELIRIIVCGCCSYTAYLAHKEEKDVWKILHIVIAVIFNPIKPIHLDRSSWQAMDFLALVICFASIFFLKLKKTK